MLLRVALAVRDRALRARLRTALGALDAAVAVPAMRRFVWDRLGRHGADVVVVAEALVPEPAARSIERLRRLPESPAVVVLAEGNDPREHARLLAAGCDAALWAGLEAEDLRNALGGILARRQEAATGTLAAPRTLAEARLTDFVSESPAMQAFMRVVQRVVASDASLLVVGETGVGKERLARAIHAEGPRASRPFVAVNCGALPEALLESELFGHEEGAFTGATRSRRGCFELAHGGTIFLDEIGEMPTHLQVRLLRVLQDHEVQPVGGERPLTVDVRVMASTNRDLEAEVQAGAFRRDLYYRLSVVTLCVPPLRERREDIPTLVDSYLEYLGPRTGRHLDGIEPEALEVLTRYDWPGNVRELINVVERAMLLAADDTVALADLPHIIQGLATPSRGSGLRPGPPAVTEELTAQPLAAARQQVVEDFERVYLEAVLAEARGRVGEAAAQAGITSRALYDKMRRYGLRKEDFRRSP
jgi:DNA-binding NtrC family response regulator